MFVDGVLAGPLNVADVGSIVSFMPIILMGVLFGLAMDYEVFLVSRMREDFVHHGDPVRAVDEGFVGSARVVTAAAIIMFSVFAAFVPDGDASIQPIAFGLAVGVAIDAFLVRMTLIPAVLVLFGRHAWWIPAWLDRTLPRFDVEGEGLAEEFALADWPAPGIRPAIAAEGVRIAGIDDLEVGAMLDDGEALVVHGGTSADRAAVLLALSARTPIVEGRLKVAGLVLPARASTVRTRTAYVRLDHGPSALTAVRDALDSGARILMIDTVDGIADPGVRSGIRELLVRAGRDPGGRSRDQEPWRPPHARDRRRRPRERTRPAADGCRGPHPAPHARTRARGGGLTWRPAPSRRRRAHVTSDGSRWSACSRCPCSSAASSPGRSRRRRRTSTGSPRRSSTTTSRSP